MNRFLNTIGLKREAVLLDSRLYIVKSILAIATGYLIGNALPLTRLDMISVLLGVMYNLEPINIVGVKGGVSQLIASTLGAACTGILVLIFGINIFTIATGMALTLYVSLKINWRMVSPVAIFTCIYMTQYVQNDALGNPSIWLTFRLRIVALGFGILIAIIYNFVFSFLYYKKIAYKRLQFAKLQLINGLEYTERQLKSKGDRQERDYISIFPAIFNDLDLVYTNIALMINESRYSFKMLHPEKLESIQRILQYFRDINHLAYDINFTVCREELQEELGDNAVRQIVDSIEVLKNIDFFANKRNSDKCNKNREVYELNSNGRLYTNIASIKEYVEMVAEEAQKL